MNPILKTMATSAAFITSSAYAACAPDMTLADLPLAVVSPSAQLVQHTVKFTVAVPSDAFNDRLVNAPLAALLPGTQKIAGVADTGDLGPHPFGQIDSPRVVCLKDGNTAVESTIEATQGKTFRYKVWAYTIDVAKPIEYGVGSFDLKAIDTDHTEVTWTYAFKLRDDIFPGNLGPVGRFIFRKTFMEGDYAEMMKVSATAMSSYFR